MLDTMNDTTKQPEGVNPAAEPAEHAKKAPAVVLEADFGQGLEKIQFVADEKSGEWEFGAVTKSQQALLSLRSLAALYQEGTDAAREGVYGYLKSVGHKIVQAAYNAATKDGATNQEAFIAGVVKAIIPPKSVTIGSLKEEIEEENKLLGALSIAQYVDGAARVQAAINLGIKTTKQDGSPLDDESLKASINNTFIATVQRVLSKQVRLGAMQAKAAEAKAKKAQAPAK